MRLNVLAVLSMMHVLGPGLFLHKTDLLILRYMQNLVLDFELRLISSLIGSTLCRHDSIS